MNVPPTSIFSTLTRETQPEPSEVSRSGSQSIPRAVADKAPAAAQRSLNVLCIDDDESVLEFMKDCLAHFGHRVKVASGGKYGIELFGTAMLKSEPYDLVITDLGMPDVNGLQVTRAIKAESPDTPVVLMTGESGKEGGVKAAGVDVVVNKPPRMHELNDLLLRLTTGRR